MAEHVCQPFVLSVSAANGRRADGVLLSRSPIGRARALQPRMDTDGHGWTRMGQTTKDTKGTKPVNYECARHLQGKGVSHWELLSAKIF